MLGGIPLIMLVLLSLAILDFSLGQLFFTLELFLFLFLHLLVIEMSHLHNEHVKLHLGVLGLSLTHLDLLKLHFELL